MSSALQRDERYLRVLGLESGTLTIGPPPLRLQREIIKKKEKRTRERWRIFELRCRDLPDLSMCRHIHRRLKQAIL